MVMMELRNAGAPNEVYELAQGIFERQVKARGCEVGEGGPLASVALDDSLKGDTYVVEADGAIRAGSPIGLLAGLGRYLTSGSFDGQGSFLPLGKHICLTPKKAVRGMYFASHFFNFYHVAPIEAVYEILEDLALRGCNALMAWYDMHHYRGVDDPESVKMIARLRLIYRYAKKLGMMLCFGALANEAFDGTPDSLKADWRAINGYRSSPVGHFHVEICPNVPGGMEEILRQRRAVLHAFADIPFDFVSFWPYDQGGCTCEKCAPWGANGFLKIAPEFQQVVDEEMPGAQMLCATWCFDHFVDGEWDAFYRRMKEPQFARFAYLFGYFADERQVPDFIRCGDMPGGKEMLSFPEISMRGAVPWGGFGANPMPAYFEQNHRDTDKYYQGGFPYSEGIFEDVNKALMLGFATGQYESAREILIDYVRYEFLAPDPEAIVSILYDMEDTLPRNRMDQYGNEQNYLRKETAPDVRYHYEIRDPSKIDGIYLRTMAVDAALPEIARKYWRWRLVYLRSVIDHELAHSGGVQTDRCEACYRELTEMYYAQEADYCVAPPSKEAMALNRGGFLL